MKSILKYMAIITALILVSTAIQTVSAEEPATNKTVLNTTKTWVNYNYALIP